MADAFDVIVVGSGFGGAVVACRAAEAGLRVLVLERGRRWTRETYPRGPADPWLYSHDEPEKHNGWLDLRLFRGMAVAQGAGVGGGSNCYSSVLLEADAWRFDDTWPPEITLAELKPYYELARKMLRAQTIPEGQLTSRFKVMRQAAEKLGHQSRFQSLPVAVSFDPEWNYDLPEAVDAKNSKSFVNDQGERQGTCVHLGNCDIGCDVRAKNTLDANYIPWAEKKGAEVRPLHLVRHIEPDAGGYRVIFDRIEGSVLEPGSERAQIVVLAAGSLGSTEILLRSRDQHQMLPNVSRALGQRWSANGNVLTPARYPKDVEVHQSLGPTITAGMDFMDGSKQGQRFFLADDGFPNVLLNALRAKVEHDGSSAVARELAEHLARGRSEQNPLKNVMIWLGEGIDGGDGTLTLRKHWYTPWKWSFDLDWNVEGTRPVIDAILETQRELTRVGGGELDVPAFWTIGHALTTVHPLGGCRMARGESDGVVDHRGEVFGYKNLFVADGAVIPSPPGRNPSLTIAALAERTARLMLEGRT
jgi:cholesterol oxidase